ncbi:hypothetical protein PO909_025067, partial [Leuciscus waleckii]
ANINALRAVFTPLLSGSLPHRTFPALFRSVLVLVLAMSSFYFITFSTFLEVARRRRNRHIRARELRS